MVRSALVIAGWLASACIAHSAEVAIVAQRDASIFGGAPGYDQVADGAGPYLWTSVTAAGVARRTLLSFDLSTIPPGAQIQQVRLSLYLSRSQALDPPVALHRLAAAWTEGPANGGSQGHGAPASTGDVTWVRRSYPSLPWAQAGGDFDPQPSASVNVEFPGQAYTWGPTPRMLADVQGWLANPATNHGWILIGVETNSQNAKRFESRNSSPSIRPMLLVTYLPASAEEGDIPIPGWALGGLGVALAAALTRRARRSTAVRTDASGRSNDTSVT